MPPVRPTRRCLFCLEWKPPSEFNREHVIPEALGGRLYVYDVCTACNSTLGRLVDAPLVHSPLMQMSRMAHGLLGPKSRHMFRRGVLADDPSRGVKVVLPGSGSGEPGVRFEPKIKRTPSPTDPDAEELFVEVDAAEVDRIPEIVNSMLRKKGKPEMDPAEILAQVESVQIEGVRTRHTGTLRFGDYVPAFLKIAYEYAWYCCESRGLGAEFLADPVADGLRRAVMDTGADDGWADHDIRGSVDVVDQSAPPFGRVPPHVHQLVLTAFDGELACHVRLFETLRASFVVASQDFSDRASVGRTAFNDVLAGTCEEHG